MDLLLASKLELDPPLFQMELSLIKSTLLIVAPQAPWATQSPLSLSPSAHPTSTSRMQTRTISSRALPSQATIKCQASMLISSQRRGSITEEHNSSFNCSNRLTKCQPRWLILSCQVQVNNKTLEHLGNSQLPVLFNLQSLQ